MHRKSEGKIHLCMLITSFLYQTGTCLIPAGDYTFGYQEASTVTATFAAYMSGKFPLFQVFHEEKTKRCHLQYTFLSEIDVWYEPHSRGRSTTRSRQPSPALLNPTSTPLSCADTIKNMVSPLGYANSHAHIHQTTCLAVDGNLWVRPLRSSPIACH